MIIESSSFPRRSGSAPPWEARNIDLPDDRVAMHARYVVAPGVELDAYATHLTDRNEQCEGRRGSRDAGARTAGVGSAHQPAGKPRTDWGRFQRRSRIRHHPSLDRQRLHRSSCRRRDRARATPTTATTSISKRVEAFPNQRIDYIFFRPGRQRRFAIKTVQLFLDRPSAEPGGRWLWASDHFGVLCPPRTGVNYSVAQSDAPSACNIAMQHEPCALFVGQSALIAGAKRDAAARCADEFDQLRDFRAGRTFAEQIVNRRCTDCAGP